MKKSKFFKALAVVGACMCAPLLFSGCGKSTESKILFRVEGGYIQVTEDGKTWKNLVDIDDLKGDQGIQGEKGDKGDQGEPGQNGVGLDGKQVEFQTTSTHIQWRYVGETDWKNLISINELNKEEEPSYAGDVCTTIWKNHNGEILYSEINHPINENPTYEGVEPVKDSPYGYPQLKYTFSGWKTTHSSYNNGVLIYRELTAMFEESLQTSGDLKVVVDDVEYQYDFENEYFVVSNFYNNRNIVAIPSEVNGVKVGGFDCQPSNLSKKEVETILLPNSIEVIGSIGYTPKLAKIKIPASVKRIESFAFYNSFNDSILEEVVFEDGSQLEYIGQSAFKGTPIKSIKIPVNVKEIGSYAFEDCTSLNSLEFEEGSKVEYNYAFIGCTSLKEVSFPESIHSFGYEAFKGCTNLRTVRIHSYQTVSITSTFEGCNLELVFTKHGVEVLGLEDYGLVKNCSSVDHDYDVWTKPESNA